MKRRYWLVNALIALLTILPLGTIELRSVQPTAYAAAWDKTVRLGWFYARPNDGMSIATLARRMDWITVTRGHDDWLEDVRDAGFRGDALQYYMPVEVQGPGPYKDKNAACDSSFAPANNTVAHGVGDFCTYIHPNESWFVHNGDGERLVSRRGANNYNYHMNPASSGWRAFVRDRIRRDLAGTYNLGFDGVYFDNVRMRLYNLAKQVDNADGTVREFDSDAEYRGAAVEFLRYQRGPINDVGKQMWGSLTDFYGVSVADYLRFTDQLDGYMSEAWGPGYLGRERSPEAVEQVLEIAEHVLKQGKGLLALVQGQRDDYTRQRYGLAQFLLIDDGQNAFFRYAYLREPYTDWWHYSNYDVDLGAPKGARYKSGNLWRRDFACGYVTADLVAERGEIVQTGCSAPSPPTPTATRVPTTTPLPTATRTPTATPLPTVTRVPTTTPAPTATPLPSATPVPTATPSDAAPFPISIPGRIEAENYAAGEGTGYRDTTTGNQGGAYRDDDVDISRCVDGSACHTISHTAMGEWLLYSINVSQTGRYTLQLRIAAPDAERRIRILVDGTDVTGSWSLPATGSWGARTTTEVKSIQLSQGVHSVKVVFERGGLNLDWIDVRYAGS